MCDAQFFFDFAKLADGDIELVTVITNAACIRYQLLGEYFLPRNCQMTQMCTEALALASGPSTSSTAKPPILWHALNTE